MTLDQWIGLASRIQHLWRTAEWSNEAIKAQYDILAELPVQAVEEAVNSIAFEGAPRPPSPGQIRKKAIDLNPGIIPAKATTPCICHEQVGAHKDCKSTHTEGWIERREVEQRAYEVILGCENRGIELQPWQYPELEETLTALLMRRNYDRNLAAGRKLDDNGSPDEDLSAAGL